MMQINSIICNCTNNIESAVCYLNELLEQSEKIFLNYGEKLQGYSRLSKDLSSDANQVTEILAGKQEFDTAQELNNVLTDFAHYIDSAMENRTSAQQNLSEITDKIHGMRRYLNEFKSVVKMLYRLGLYSKIETSRLGMDAEGFGILAAGIEDLAASLESVCRKINSNVVEINLEANKTYNSQKVDSRKLSDLNCHFVEEFNSLVSLITQNREQSRESHNQLASAARCMYESINKAVISLQFHDITRQQIEHIIDASNYLKTAIEGKDIASLQSNTNERKLLINIIYNTISLQSSQLKHSRHEIRNAAANLFDEFKHIAVRATDIKEEISKLIYMSSGSVDCYLVSLEVLLGELETEMGSQKESLQKFNRAIITLSSMFTKLTSHIDDIEEISADIELLAINAQIRAARIGDRGAGLGIIAEEIQALAKNARAQADQIVTQLSQLSSLAVTISDTSDRNVKYIIQNSNSLIETTQDFSEKLNNYNLQIQQKVQDLDQIAEKISSQIQSELGNTILNKLYDQSITRSLDVFEKISSLTLHHGAERNRDYILHDKTLLEDQYTMESERKLYNKFDKSSDEEIAAADTLGDEMDDNIEFF